MKVTKFCLTMTAVATVVAVDVKPTIGAPGIPISARDDVPKVHERIDLSCGMHRVAITCGRALPAEPRDDRACIHNTLVFTASDGRQSVIDTPTEYVQERGTPAGLSCAMGIDGKNYVTVTYSFCRVLACRVYELYSESGQRLTVRKKRANQGYDRIAGQLRLPFDGEPLMIEE